MAVSHAGPHRRLKRYAEYGWARMEHKSSRPGSCLGEALAAREKHREGPVELVERSQVAARLAEILPDEKGPTCDRFLAKRAG